MAINQKPVSVDWNQDNESWDMGLSDLIEESPAINPFRKTQFHSAEKKGATFLYMQRRTPSWKGTSATA